VSNEQQPSDAPISIITYDINNATRQSQSGSSYTNMLEKHGLKHKASNSSIQYVTNNHFGINDNIYVSS
jgi:hypothetical protein